MSKLLWIPFSWSGAFPLFQFEILSVKNSVCKVRYPVPEVDVRPISDFLLDGLMIVPHNDVVKTLIQFCCSKFFHPIHLAVVLLRGVMPALPRRELGEANANIGMKEGIQPDAERISENLLQDLVADVFVSQSIAVVEEELRSVNRHGERFGENLDAQFRVKKITQPEVVISSKIVDLDSLLNQIGKLRQQSMIALRDHRSVFEPEVEKIAEDKKTVAVRLHHLEELDQLPFFLFFYFRPINPEMGIGYEVCLHKVIL